MSEADVDGYPRQVWWNADGETIVESYTITDMAHGTPLGVGDNDEKYGAQGAFLIEAGISSSYHIANFFGLTEWIRQPEVVATAAAKDAVKHAVKDAAKPNVALVPVPTPDLTAVLWPLVTLRHRPESSRRAEPPHAPRRRGIDVSAVITRALTAAGLMK
jgi:hypothetical protein